MTNDEIIDKSFKINKNGSYNVIIIAEDNSDNITTVTRTVKIDTQKPNPTVILPEGFINDTWYDHDLTFSFTEAIENVSGVKYQYSSDGGTSWTDTNDAKSHTFGGDTNATYKFRSISGAGIISEETVLYTVKIKMTAPAIPEVSVLTDVWHTTNQELSVSLLEDRDGVGIMAQYRIKTDDGSYSIWDDVYNSKIPVSQDSINTMEVRTINQFGNTNGKVERTIKVDKTAPEITVTGNSTEWTKEDVTLNIMATSGASGVNNITVDGVDITGDSTYIVSKNGTYTFIVTNGAGVTDTEVVTVEKIDRGVPEIIGADESGSYYFGRRISFDIGQGELDFAKDNYENMANDVWIEIPIEHTVVVQDMAGNRTALTFKIKEIPYTNSNIKISEKEDLSEIKDAFDNTRSIMPKEVSAEFENQLNILENRIAQLEKQVIYFKDIVRSLSTVDTVKITDEKSVQDALDIYNTFTTEQKSMTYTEKNKLDNLKSTITGLKYVALEIEDKINALPNVSNLNKDDATMIADVYESYNKLRDDQKAIVSAKAKTKLDDCMVEIKKILLVDEKTQTSVEGVGDTIFEVDVYLVVNPITESTGNDEITKQEQETTEKSKTAVKSNMDNKELVGLYNISLMKDDVEVEPDGQVKVKIKIPEQLKGREGLDVVHITDD